MKIMTAYINSIKGTCNSEEGFPEGALGMTALAVSCHNSSVPNPVCGLQVDDLRLSGLSLHTIAAARSCLDSSRVRIVNLAWMIILKEQSRNSVLIAGAD